MRFILILRCTTWILSFLCLRVLALAQQEVRIVQQPDSISENVKGGLLNEIKDLKKILLNNEYRIDKSFTTDSKEALNPVVSRIRLLQGKPKITISDINLTLGYSYLHDTSTATRGMYNKLESIYSYNGDYGLALSGIPFRGSVNVYLVRTTFKRFV